VVSEEECGRSQPRLSSTDHWPLTTDHFFRTLLAFL
jgi:hypothetical protein